ncbi:MAG TPA: PP2C family protein-serine/threonine phosphatase [Actinomycetes bacterium]|nr:PP2C family protein-serine/threonine phosphatase [Actinomycetes bacterium]
MQATSRWMLAAVLVTSAIALLDAATGAHPVLLGLLIAGPLLAAATLHRLPTALVGGYALALAVLLGIPGGRFATTDHLLGCLVVATGAALGGFIAQRRAQQERALVRITRIAEVVEGTILRPIPPRIGRVALAVRYLSASEDALVGGDFYDVAVTRQGLRVLVGDVKGKGLEAVQLAALVLASFRAAAAVRPSLAELAGELDRSIRPRLGQEDFVTAVLAEFDRHGELRLVNCGHPPPLRVRAGAAEPLATAAPTTPLGLGPTPTVQRFALAAADRVLLYTDGLLEARSREGRQFQLDGQVPAVLAAPSLGAALDGLVGRLLEHAGGRLGDDLALVLAQPRQLLRRTA